MIAYSPFPDSCPAWLRPEPCTSEKDEDEHKHEIDAECADQKHETKKP